jgi:uncharacterized damage-inducible protein DinB
MSLTIRRRKGMVSRSQFGLILARVNRVGEPTVPRGPGRRLRRLQPLSAPHARGLPRGLGGPRPAVGSDGGQGRTLDEEQLHESVDGEWSFIQTLRHLAYATDLWVFAVVQGLPDPYDPLDLPFDGYERFPNGIRYARDACPPLADVLALRRDRVARVRAFLGKLTQEQIESTVRFESTGWPFTNNFHVGQCLSTVVNEEWHHRNFAERDLDRLIAAER